MEGNENWHREAGRLRPLFFTALHFEYPKDDVLFSIG
jgi:hypothetical protein